MLPKNIAFVDVETTGLSVTGDRIIEIGIIRVENGEIVATYSTLINPETYISPDIERITGIKKEDLENAPSFYEVSEKIANLLSDCFFVAHNVRFDYGFLRNEFKRANKKFTSKHFCTVKLSRRLFPKEQHHNLDAIIDRFAIRCRRRHRAFDDADVLWKFYQAIQKEISQETLEAIIAEISGHPSVPSKLSAHILDTLPQQPGVYIFYGENGVPLYVGKSINIRDRVMSHFTSDYTSSKEMHLSAQVEHIETIITSGELGALIKESELVKKLQPLYNRKLRLVRKLLILRSILNKTGYHETIMEEVSEENIHKIQDIIGIYKSKKQIKHFLSEMNAKHSLCEKLLGLEKGKGACFAYRLGKCRGACVGEEKPFMYNMRFLTAFSLYKIKAWPFTGPIEIREENELEETIDRFVIDKWCLLPSEDMTYHFDMDVYKIILSYIQNKKNYKNIHVLSRQGEHTIFSE